MGSQFMLLYTLKLKLHLLLNTNLGLSLIHSVLPSPLLLVSFFVDYQTYLCIEHPHP